MTDNVVAALKSSKSVEWYTPARYVEVARELMGGIDLDPASNVRANVTVQAERFFTVEDDGLAQEWHGRVWLNPPYGKMCAPFVAKLREEYAAGRVSEAVLLVSAQGVETRWFQPLFSRPICFVDHRIKFVSGFGQPSSSSTIANAFIYFGHRPNRFVEVFSTFGAVVEPLSPEGAS